MSRDIADRMRFFGVRLEFKRLALNMDQVEEYDPPPNPAKITDSRAEGYIAEFGESSWELDALEPTVLARLIRDAITEIRDEGEWRKSVAEEDSHREDLAIASDRWEDVATFLREEE